jgi:hypothetical protein
VHVAGFEATLALYMNVERIGRYLQAFQESSTGPLDAPFSRLANACHLRQRSSSRSRRHSNEIRVIVVIDRLINRISRSRQAARSVRPQNREHFQTVARPEV